MSPKLPIIKPKQLIQALQRAGFVFNHQTGSHISLQHPEYPKLIVTVPYHNKDLKKGTLKSILRQSNIDLEEFLRLL